MAIRIDVNWRLHVCKKQNSPSQSLNKPNCPMRLWHMCHCNMVIRILVIIPSLLYGTDAHSRFYYTLKKYK